MSSIKQIDELTGLRGIAALFILFNHILLIYPDLRQTFIASPLGFLGFMGMDLFFILSGFVIYYNYADKIRQNPNDGIIKFLIARIARLYPLYLLFIAFFFVFNFLEMSPNYKAMASNFTSFPIYLSGMQSWFYGFINDTAIIYLQGSANISWSISTEFALYLFFIPIILLSLKAVKLKLRLETWHLLFVALLMLNVFWIKWAGEETFISKAFDEIFGKIDSYDPQTWLIYHSPLSRVFQFLIGVIVAIIYRNFDFQKQSTKLYKILKALTFVILIVYITSINKITFTDKSTMSVIFSALIVLSTSIGTAKFLKTKPLILMGELSYSTYLLHIIFVQFLRYDGEHLISYVVNVPIFFIITYFVAWIVYKYYEMPMRKAVRNFLLMKYGENNEKKSS